MERPLRTRRDSQRGQVLVLFVGGLVGFLAIAALVFDVGQNLLDWRTQRDAADASALAGSRYIADPRDPSCLSAPSVPNCPHAVAAALRVAALNGYGDTDGDGLEDRGHVTVDIPPTAEGDYTGEEGFLQVTIHTDRPSFFAAVLGLFTQNVDAMAIAGNSTTVTPDYAMLALNEDCDPNPSGQVGGNGDVQVDGSVLLNSDCDGALLVNGNGALKAPECGVVGTVQVSGKNALLDCPTPGFDGTNDPLIGRDPGPMPGSPAPVDILFYPNGPPTIPPGCPGSTVQINFVGAAYTALESVTLPAYAIGDIAVVFAYRSSSNAPPDLPVGWTSIDSGGNDNNGSRVGYRVLDGSETTTGTWTNATAVEVVILQGQDTDVPIGAHASAGSAGTTLTTPALTLTPTPTATSWVVAFGGAWSGANATTLAIPGQTVTARNGAISSLSLHTGQRVTSWPQTNYGGAVVGPNRTHAIEILANPAPSTAANPVGCTLNGAGAQKYNVFRLHPGVYFGGIHLAGSRARVYLAPGTYWLAGGGLSISGKDNQLVSVNGTSSTTPGRGVFFYDTEDTYYHNQCAADPNYNNGCISDINVNGGTTGACSDPPQPLPPSWTPSPPTQPCQWVHLEPATYPTVPITNLLIFIDRDFAGIDVFFNGDAGKLQLVGTIYDPLGEVRVNGGADDTVSAVIISYTFKITGNGGFHVTYDANGVIQLSGAGLVQ